MGCCESKNLKYNIENDDKNSDIAITDIVACGKSLDEKKDKGVVDDINGNVAITTEPVTIEDKNVKPDESDFTDVDLNDQDADHFESAKLEISELKETENTEDDTDAEKGTEESTVSLPPPRPPQKLRKDLVPDVKVFARIDNMADQVPQTDHRTVEALAKYLTDD